MPPFQDFGFFVHNIPEATAQELRASRVELQHKRKPFLTPLGICFRFIVNEKTLNVKKTTSSVLSVLLFNLCMQVTLTQKLLYLNKT